MTVDTPARVAPLLAIENLHVEFALRGLDNRVRVARALNGVSLAVRPGEVAGLVGETGAGKSLTALAVLGLLRAPARITAGTMHFAGTPIDPTRANVRGRDIALVPQSPHTSLDPLCRIGDQLVRMQREHQRITADEARRRARDALVEVRIPDPDRILRAWPHEVSGGMAQRALIAMAIVNQPRLIIADEPTTGLDVTVQADVLDTLRALVRTRGLALLVITHDLGIVAHYCDHVSVMYAGRIVEQGSVRAVFARPAHPYTRALIGATPKRMQQAGATVGAGAPPDLYALPAGCAYRDRCPSAGPRCEQDPPDVPVGQSHTAQCHFAEAVS